MVADAVKEFAESRGITSILWYHGDAWWYVREELSNQSFREVHVVFSAERDGEYLFLMPQVCKFLPGASPKVVRPTQWIRHPVDVFNNADRAVIRKVLGSLLTEAWSEAEKLIIDE